MNSRVVILVVLLSLAGEVALIRAQATNPPYLSQFPSVERIKADVRGVDAMETAAKQAGIFWQLRQLISLLAYSQRRTDRQFTPDEQRLEPLYRNAYYYAMEPFEGKVTGDDKLRWFELHSKYEFDLWLRDEVFKKYFTPELRRAVYVALKGEVPTRNAPDGSLLAPTAAEIAAFKAKSAASPPQPTAQPSTAASGSARDFRDQGRKYSDAKDHAKAIEAYKKSISLEPSGNGYNGLGFAYKALKQYADAAAAFQQGIRLEPDDATLRSNLGSTYMEMEQYENAIAAFREAIRLKPDLAYTINQLGIAYYRLEQFPEALTAYQQAIRLAPNNASYVANLGVTYVDTRRKAEALQIYEKLQKLDPAKANKFKDDIGLYLDHDEPEWFEALISVGFQSDDLVSVLRACHHLIALKPADPTVLSTAHNGRGNVFAELKKYEKAVAEYREAIRLAPKNPAFHNNLGRTYLATGQKDQALQVYKTLQRLDRKMAIELYAKINEGANPQAAVKSGNAAGQPASERVQAAPGNSSTPSQPSTSAATRAEAYVAQGDKYREAKDYAKAIAAYKKAIVLKPSVVAYFFLGTCYEDQGQYQLAISAYKQSLALKPDAGVFTVLGIALRKFEQYDEAIQAYKKAIALKPTSVEAYNGLALIYNEQGQYQLEISALKQSLALKPDDASSLIALGLAHYNLKQYAEALEAYRRAIRLKPDDASSLIALGLAHYNLKQYAEALEAYRRAIRLKPDSETLATAHKLIGETYDELKQYPNALAALQQAVRLKPDYARAHQMIGATYNKMDQYERALGPLREALRLKPDDHIASADLGLAYYGLKQYPEAVAALQQAIRLKPDDGVAYYVLGSVYLTMGRKNEALQVYRRLLSIDKAAAQDLYEAINKSK